MTFSKRGAAGVQKSDLGVSTEREKERAERLNVLSLFSLFWVLGVCTHNLSAIIRVHAQQNAILKNETWGGALFLKNENLFELY